MHSIIEFQLNDYSSMMTNKLKDTFSLEILVLLIIFKLEMLISFWFYSTPVSHLVKLIYLSLNIFSLHPNFNASKKL